jgi:hypothetical protein
VETPGASAATVAGALGVGRGEGLAEGAGEGVGVDDEVLGMLLRPTGKNIAILRQSVGDIRGPNTIAPGGALYTI